MEDLKNHELKKRELSFIIGSFPVGVLEEKIHTHRSHDAEAKRDCNDNANNFGVTKNKSAFAQAETGVNEMPLGESNLKGEQSYIKNSDRKGNPLIDLSMDYESWQHKMSSQKKQPKIPDNNVVSSEKKMEEKKIHTPQKTLSEFPSNVKDGQKWEFSNEKNTFRNSQFISENDTPKKYQAYPQSGKIPDENIQDSNHIIKPTQLFKEPKKYSSNYVNDQFQSGFFDTECLHEGQIIDIGDDIDMNLEFNSRLTMTIDKVISSSRIHDPDNNTINQTDQDFTKSNNIKKFWEDWV